jgi:spermidine/putrescine transport system substrate-binding protein
MLRDLGLLGLGGVLGACERSVDRPVSSTGTDWASWWSTRASTGVLDFANWPYYIDRRRDNSHPSLELFTAETGIRVNYTRPIRGNARFLEKTQAELESGSPIGYDIIVLTNGPELSKLMSSGWLTPLDRGRLRRFDKYASDLVRDPPWDPGNRFTVAWQSGFTGIAYRPEAVQALGREPSGFGDLWNSALRRRVGMMNDLLDLGSVGLLVSGIDPVTSSEGDWVEAASVLRTQRENVEPRYYDQGYLQALIRGDTWASLAWSGDVFQANNLGNNNLRFVVPTEGAMFWTDNMMIPANAANPADAMTFMDFVYRPDVAAMIADWVWYLTPVPSARRIVAREFGNMAVANSPLVFPSDDFLGGGANAAGGQDPEDDGTNVRSLPSRVREYHVFSSPDEYSEWERIFQPIVYGS